MFFSRYNERQKKGTTNKGDVCGIYERLSWLRFIISQKNVIKNYPRAQFLSNQQKISHPQMTSLLVKVERSG